MQEQSKKNQEPRTNAVAQKAAAGALAVATFEADANRGVENLTHEDLALPFLKILGQLSPEVNKRDGKYVQGAEPGMIYNSVTGELFDGENGIEVIPCHYKLEYIEWQDRGEGSGAPVAIHSSSSDILSKTTRGTDYKDRLPNGNYIEKTASHFVVVLGKSPSTALIAMKSTQLKISRKWNSMMASIKMKGKNGMFTPAFFSHTYKLRTTQQSNDKGTWFGWEVSKIGPVQDAALYQQAKSFSESVSKGDVKVKHGESTEGTKSEASHF
jgi:hypothetical protein